MKVKSPLRRLPNAKRPYVALCACLIVVAFICYAPVDRPGAQTPDPEPTPTLEEDIFTLELPQDPPPDGETTNALAFTAADPVALDPNDPNKRYLTYEGKKVVLLGVSGDYLPHVPRSLKANGASIPSSFKIAEQCGYDVISPTGTLPQVYKYKNCIDALAAAKLNKMRLYVSVNHSPGKLFEMPAGNTEPYDHEQPFVWRKGNDAVVEHRKKWDLDTLDTTYFQRLREVVAYCNQKKIVVEVTFFDPWDTEDLTSPYNAANNYAANPTTGAGLGFTNSNLHVQGENTTAYNFGATELIDTAPANKKMRDYQLAVVRATVDALYDLNNFYWELANEADRHSGVGGVPFLNWHYYMAKQLRDYEEKKQMGRHHLIGVNFSLKTAIDSLRNNPTASQYIDIVNGHYVRIGGSGQDPTPSSPFGAMEMIRQYNLYTGVNNNKVWGFNEDRITGIDPPPAPLTPDPDPADHHGVRAEAWEFIFNGGGVFDQLAYRWANSSTGENRAASNKSRENLSYLAYIMKGITDLDNMKRSSSWIANPRPYGSPEPGVTGNLYWAAMKNNDTFLYYAHHSTYSVHGSARYHPAAVSAYTARLSVQNLGTCSHRYQADWIRPDNHDPLTGPTPLPIKSETFYQGGSSGNTHLLKKKSYPDFDVALRIKRLTTVCTLPSTVPGPNVALASNGAVATASSTYSAGYPASAVNNGVRTAANWGSGGGWNDATESAYPDWVQINFNGPKTISEIDVITLQDNYASGIQPTTDELFSLYGITDYELQYLDSTTGTWEPLGGVTENRNVWRRFTFESVTTSAIRVVVTASLYPSPTNHSRIVEIEAY